MPGALPLQEELALLSRARSLDADALASIHSLYYARIYRYIAFHIGDRETAKDLCGEVFARFLSALRDHTAPRKTLGGWLFGVARHLINDHFRQQYRVEEVELDESIASEEAGPAARLDDQLLRDDLRRALGSLTPDQRHVIALRIGQGLPIEEVARLLGKSVGAIKQMQLRALAAIARDLAREAKD
jgi:RNA polymerase sigma-70 factor (ECF subfamily)